MSTVLQSKDNANHTILYLAFELSAKKWKLAFGNGAKVREKTIAAGDWPALLSEIAGAREKLRCSDNCQIVSCYEAGRDGFWIHRALLASGISNHVIDSASIEVSRKHRRAKTDLLDVLSLLRLLIRYLSGESQAMSVVNVPTVEQEGQRRICHERQRLVKERGAHSARIKSLLVLHGIKLEKLSDLPTVLKSPKAAVIGYRLPGELVDELQREYERYRQVHRQLTALEQLEVKRAQQDNRMARQIQQLVTLKGVGWRSSWVLSSEFFNWRQFKNTKQVGACAGLTPTPYDSGDGMREQGISKAGNKHIRRTMVELAWLWLRYQPDSALSQWFTQRFAHGSKRMRRIGIVALARKLLIAFWRYLEFGEVPRGALLKA